MKKYKYFLVYIPLYILLLFGCSGFSLQPGFITILGDESDSVKIVDVTQEMDNSIKITFSKPIKHLDTHIFFEDNQNTSTEIIHTTTQTNLNNNNENNNTVEYKSTILNNIDIGQKFRIKGIATTKNNINLEFSFLFRGKNTNPAILEISEYKPFFSKSLKNPIPEFIELKVIKAGNLSDIKITNIGSKQNSDYIFPASEVKKNELIMVYLRYNKNNDYIIKDEINNTNASKGLFSNSLTRAFWGNFDGKTPLQRKTNIVAVLGPELKVQDCLAYCKKVKNKVSTLGSEFNALKRQIEQTKFKNMVENPIIDNITASTSIARFYNAGIKKWFICGTKKNMQKMSPGKENQQ